MTEINKKEENAIYVLGSGVSLTGFDFSLLDNKKVICCNHSYKFIKNPMHVVYIDNAFIRELYSTDLQNLFNMGKKVYSPSPFTGGMKGQFFGYKPTKSQTLNKEELVKIDSCGITAISLALKYNPDVIYLLGLDYKVLETHEIKSCFEENTRSKTDQTFVQKVHFSDDTEGHRIKLDKVQTPNKTNGLYGKKIKTFDMFKSKNIINLSKFSALDQFKKQSIIDHFYNNGGNNYGKS